MPIIKFRSPKSPKLQFVELGILKLYYYQRTKIQPAAGDGGSYYYKQEEEEKEKREEEEVIIDTPPFNCRSDFAFESIFGGRVIIVTFTLDHKAYNQNFSNLGLARATPETRERCTWSPMARYACLDPKSYLDPECTKWPFGLY